jgi:hypothetical protein
MIAVDQLVRIIATFDLDGVSKAQNVYHAECTNDAAQEDSYVLQAGLEFVENAMANLTTLINEDVSLETVEVYARVEGEFEPLGSKAGTWSGSAGGERLPSGVAALVRFFKLRSGYSDKKYLAGFHEGTITGDQWSAALITGCENYADDVIAEFTASNDTQLTACSFDRVSGVTTPYSDKSVSSVPAYQRRRRPGVGLT